MTFAIIGAGAIGGLVGARLALAGEDVTFIARRPHVEAIRRHGFVLVNRDGTESVATTVRATPEAAQAGPHDVVILAMKAHQVEAVVDDLAPLLHANTVIVPMQNGIPFWYFQRDGGEFQGRTVRSVDPHGRLAAGIAPERVLGCVVYPASELVAPGRVHHVEGERFPLGEPDGHRSERALQVSEAFQRAGFKAPVLEDIRVEIWLKLWGNLCFNPISALAHATLADICSHAEARALAAGMMREAQAVAERLGIRFRVDLETRIAGAARVGHHKTSMLQDVEAGRAPEIDALLGSVVELAELARVPVPRLEAVYALVRLLAQRLQATGGRLALPEAAGH